MQFKHFAQLTRGVTRSTSEVNSSKSTTIATGRAAETRPTVLRGVFLILLTNN